MSRYDHLLDTLREARRYVRSDPDEAIGLVHAAQRSIGNFMQGNDGYRLLCNLDAGVRFVRCDPDVLKGYIDGAIIEIQNHASKEKA